jgi:DNA-binding NarL/FixJ family response regulator
VEDEVLARIALMAMLERAAFRVVPVTSAEEALQVLANVPEIRAVVTDVGLSSDGMNGFELAQKIRTEWRLPVVVVSGRAGPDQEALPSGVHFLAKPVHGATLVHLVQDLIGLGAASTPHAIRLPERLLTHVDPAISAPEREPEPVLTPRQRAVLERLVQGKSNRDIAVALEVAENTVKVHMAAVFKALSVSSRVEALLAGKPLLERMQNKRDEEHAPSGLS